MPPDRDVKPEYYVQVVEINVNNEDLSDAEFRQFIRNTLPIVIYQPLPEMLEEVEAGVVRLEGGMAELVSEMAKLKGDIRG